MNVNFILSCSGVQYSVVKGNQKSDSTFARIGRLLDKVLLKVGPGFNSMATVFRRYRLFKEFYFLFCCGQVKPGKICSTLRWANRILMNHWEFNGKSFMLYVQTNNKDWSNKIWLQIRCSKSKFTLRYLWLATHPFLVKPTKIVDAAFWLLKRGTNVLYFLTWKYNFIHSFISRLNLWKNA